ncbi:hypothetical protein G6F26_000351 [Rhizopus arrhizus]|nr:hypothetical protein G6F24_000154 [Rhizopus arrhizus]KAG0820321.1 hypothetical protein G6F20_000044 [Rhizopus arrhizus]KAG0844008.1 hypothetical protein G6F19_000139 [Rhizopus arrhizus]KAG0846390.1 hypothetical protein G6F18_000085 [Rhizopus arrhizus]KAG0861416.1 hypothetical protein G6F17_000115 [Rhizopus arrhizus]
MDFLKNPLQHSGIVDLRSSVVLPLIVDFLLSHSLPAESRAPIQMDDRQAFVFKQLRPKKLIQSLDGVFSLFFTAVDQLPHTFDCVVINPQTSLCLTLGDVSISTSSCPLPKSMACLPSSNAYQVDLTSGRLQRKCFTDIRSRPYLTKRFLKWVRSDKLKLSSFFVRTFLLPCSAPLNDPPFTPVVHTRVDMSSFLTILSLTSDTDGGSILTSKIYRRLCNPIISSSSLYHLFLLPNGRNCGVFLFTLRVEIFGIVRSTTSCLVDPTCICLPKSVSFALDMKKHLYTFSLNVLKSLPLGLLFGSHSLNCLSRRIPCAVQFFFLNSPNVVPIRPPYPLFS